MDGTSFLQASADVTAHLYAFGRAEDPLVFDPGPNTVNDSISGVVLSADPGAIGSGFYVSITSTIDTLATLYRLNIFVPGGVATVDDININFTSDPSLGFDDTAIEATLRSSFSVSANTATQFASVTLTYLLNPAQPYELSSSVEADAMAGIPEPNTLCCLAVASFIYSIFRIVGGKVAGNAMCESEPAVSAVAHSNR
jgi:hypothetical protein